MIITLSPPGVRCQVGDFVMLVDPSSDRKANLILKTRVDLPLDFPLPPEVVAGAGEYEISGVRVKGINLAKESAPQILRTIYLAELEGIRLAFLGELGDPPAAETLDGLGTVDILFLAVSAGKAKQITTLIKQVDPKMIVPIGEKPAKLLMEELGQKVKAEEKLVIKKKDLAKEEVAKKLVWLKS